MRTFFIAVCLSFLLVAPVRAADVPLSIGVLDIGVLMTKSKAAQNIGDQLKAYRDKVFKSLSADEEKLIAEEKTLTESRKELSKEDFSKKVQDFEKGKLELQKKSMQFNNRLNEASAKAERALMDKVVEITGEIASEKQYSLVISKRDVVVGAVSLDITDQVLSRLDKRYSKIEVPLKD